MESRNTNNSVDLNLLGQDVNPETGTLEALMPQDLVCDENGNPLAIIKINPQDKRIYSIQTLPYENKAGVAENNQEKICVVDDQGEIDMNIETTRKMAREKNIRYLVVSNLVIHKNKVLLQKRSKNKKIDPGKLSVSAHGVAKPLYSSRRTKWGNIDNLALVNSAIELNEELRHGETEKTFSIRFWYGKRSELQKYVQEKNINDSNTIFLLPMALDQENNYPLERDGVKDENKRSRALCVGYVFSNEVPRISIDPGEVDSVVWAGVEDIEQELLGDNMNKDTKEMIPAAIDILREQDGVDAAKRMIVRDVLSKMNKS